MYSLYLYFDINKNKKKQNALKLNLKEGTNETKISPQKINWEKLLNNCLNETCDKYDK